MRLVVVCQECPYPAMHGGTVDMWRRLKALKRLGVRVFLISWSENPTLSMAEPALAEVVDESVVFGYQRGWLVRLALWKNNFNYPSPVLSRWLTSASLADLARRALTFRATHVMQDGLMGGNVARKIAELASLPLLVRSHNVEHLYWERQLARATGLAWIKVRLRLIGLKPFELDGLRQAQAFFDISADDLSFWQTMGLRNGQWLPPLIDQQLAGPDDEGRPAIYDIAFVGNLRMPNNVEGVRWLLQKVLPKVEGLLGRPAKVLLAGSTPTREVRQLVNFTPGTELLPNFSALADVLRSARVLVNPVLAGSGVALKTVDMLLSGKLVISTSQGVAGLPADVKSLVRVADNPDDFAACIVGAFCNPKDNDRLRFQQNAVVNRFGDAALTGLVDLLKGSVV